MTKRVKHIIFNCSEALLFAPQSLFYSSLLSVLKKVKQEIEPRTYGDIFTSLEEFCDPEDVI